MSKFAVGTCKLIFKITKIEIFETNSVVILTLALIPCLLPL